MLLNCLPGGELNQGGVVRPLPLDEVGPRLRVETHHLLSQKRLNRLFGGHGVVDDLHLCVNNVLDIIDHENIINLSQNGYSNNRITWQLTIKYSRNRI